MPLGCCCPPAHCCQPPPSISLLVVAGTGHSWSGVGLETAGLTKEQSSALYEFRSQEFLDRIDETPGCKQVAINAAAHWMTSFSHFQSPLLLHWNKKRARALLYFLVGALWGGCQLLVIVKL